MVDVPNNTASQRYGWANTAALALMGFGVTQQAFGAYYGALANRYEAKSAASSMRSAQEMSALESRGAEDEAQLLMQEGAREGARAGLAYRALKGSARASLGARGVEGAGAAEELASIEIANQTDRYQINANAVRAAGLARMRATNARNRGVMLGINAANADRTARSINPWLAGGSTFLSGGGQIAGTYAASQERRAILAGRAG